MLLTVKNMDSTKKCEPYKVFTKNGKELFAYTIRGEGEEEEEATISLLAYENKCQEGSIHVHIEMR